MPAGTTITVGDPSVKVALELSGLIKELDFNVEFANISGGPQTTEAFRANALDVGLSGGHPADPRAPGRAWTYASSPARSGRTP